MKALICPHYKLVRNYNNSWTEKVLESVENYSQ